VIPLKSPAIDSTSKPARYVGQTAILTKEDKHIILDTVTTSWVCCDKEVLDAYMKCDGSRTVSDLVKETNNRTTVKVIGFLHDLGLISTEPAKDVRKPPDWPDRLEVDIGVLKVTRRCNLSCSYCYADCGPQGEDMPLGVARKIIDRLFELPQHRIGIQWGGGEPLLAFGVIEDATRHAVNKAKETGKEVKIVMQTNGTLVNRHLSKLRELGIGFGVSLDGPEKINDQNRTLSDGTGSYKLVENCIRKVTPACLVTLSQASAPHIEEIINHFHRLGIRGLKINPCRPQGRGQINRRICLDPLEFTAYKIRALEETFRLRRNGLKMQIPENTAQIVRNLLDSSQKNANCFSSPSCGAGLRMLGFDVNGDVYPCDELTGARGYECGNVFERSLNDIFSNSPVIRKFRARNVYNIPKCRPCMWRHFCGGGCAASAAYEYNDIMREDPYCEFRRRYFEYVLWKLALSHPRDWIEAG